MLCYPYAMLCYGLKELARTHLGANKPEVDP